MGILKFICSLCLCVFSFSAMGQEDKPTLAEARIIAMELALQARQGNSIDPIAKEEVDRSTHVKVEDLVKVALEDSTEKAVTTTEALKPLASKIGHLTSPRYLPDLPQQ